MSDICASIQMALHVTCVSASVQESRGTASLTVALLLQEEPYVMMKPSAGFFIGNDRFEGFLVDVLRLVADAAGFDYEICLSTDGRYGDISVDGRWDGIIGEVVRRVRNQSSPVDFCIMILSTGTSLIAMLRALYGTH
jgi:Ligated ion channel L-glutamate- and glycine-binding site